MKRNYIVLFSVVLLFFILILDGQIATLITNYLPRQFTINSHLLFMFGIFLFNYIEMRYSLILFSLLGFIYDIYYLGFLGIAFTLFPLSVFFIYYFYRETSVQRLMNAIILLVVVFIFEFLGFGFARLFHITNLSVFIFLVYNLLPSLVFNLSFFFVLQPLLERAFGITNKT